MSPGARANSALLVLLLTAVAAGQTSGTLRLEDVFSAPPATPSARDWPTQDPAVPSIRVHPRSLFRVEPTPTPNLDDEATTWSIRTIDVRGIRPRLAQKVDATIDRDKPHFTSAGKVTGPTQRTAVLSVKNEFHELYSRLSLVPQVDKPTSGTTILLGPGTGSTFYVKFGTYRIVHEAWDPDQDHHVFVHHPSQELLPGVAYKADWSQPLEAELQKRIKDLATQEAHPAATAAP